MSPSAVRVTSRQHPFVRACRDLAAGRGAAAEVLLDGAHVVEEALRARVPLIGVLVDDRGAETASAAHRRHVPVYEGGRDVLDAASPVRTGTGVVAIARWSPQDAVDLVTPSASLLVGLVGIQDPGNVGSIIRSSDALGASAVLALDDTAHPGGWKAVRGAMGSTFRLPVGRGPSSDVVAALRAHGVMIAAAVAEAGQALDGWQPSSPVCLLVGNEGAGLPQPLVSAADVRLTIPMRSGTNSLNVGVSTALLLWEAARARRLGRGSS